MNKAATAMIKYILCPIRLICQFILLLSLSACLDHKPKEELLDPDDMPATAEGVSTEPESAPSITADIPPITSDIPTIPDDTPSIPDDVLQVTLNIAPLTSEVTIITPTQPNKDITANYTILMNMMLKALVYIAG